MLRCIGSSKNLGGGIRSGWACSWWWVKPSIHVPERFPSAYMLQAKDCIHLLHLWLAKRELQSRRVKNKTFEGVDIRELDVIPPQSS